MHGDVKPSNIVMVRNRVFLIDFGNAWTLEQSAHRPSGEGLSGPYSSPEQYRGDGFSGVASDYFSASVIGYQLLTRQLPFNGLGGKSGISQGGNNTTVKLVPASELSPYRALMRPEFWQHIDQILSTALDLTATNRFPIASAWLDEIESLNSLLKQKTTFTPWNKKLVNAMNWFASWFRKNNSSV